MESQANFEMRQAATPSKATREGASSAGYEAGVSTPGPVVAMMDISSPDPAATSLKHTKQPPAISSKPRSSRKVSSLFGDHRGEAAAAAGSKDGSAGKRGEDGDRVAAPAGGGDAFFGASRHDPPSPFPSREAPSGGGAGGGGGSSGAGGFASPVRVSTECGAASSRFTPQRNLGGLFASPLPPPPRKEEDGGVSAAVPLLLRSPKGEEPPAAVGASCTPVEEAAAPPRPVPQTSAAGPYALAVGSPKAAGAATAAAPPAAAVPATPSPAATPAAPGASPAAALSPATHERPVSACRCGCSASSSGSGATEMDAVCGSVCCVSNKAFEDGKAMRTLEVLVKRERVGVSTLASWRVAELKRRLVHLRLLPAGEAIALVPTFPLDGAALADDVVLETLDADVTYKARRVAVAPAS